jgi:hypothetical protein
MRMREEMSDEFDERRRRFFLWAGITLAGTQFTFGTSGKAQSTDQASDRTGIFKAAANSSFVALRQINAAA